jgi:hypothetical protein
MTSKRPNTSVWATLEITAQQGGVTELAAVFSKLAGILLDSANILK